FVRCEERRNHDLDAIAQHFLDDQLSRLAEHEALLVEYRRADRYWSIIYPNLGLFKTQYNACSERLLAGMTGATTLSGVVTMPEATPDREPSLEVKAQVKARDGYRCLSCGEDTKQRLEIDHVAPSYLGGTNALDNLQTLCRVCNNHKGGINEINFRNRQTLLAGAPAVFPELQLPGRRDAAETSEWEKYIRR